MEANGLVERRMRNHDERSVLLFLSSAAYAKTPDIIARSRRVNREVMALLPKKEAKNPDGVAFAFARRLPTLNSVTAQACFFWRPLGTARLPTRQCYHEVKY